VTVRSIRQRETRRPGFTLVEAVVAVAIAAVASGVLLLGLQTAINTTEHAKEQTIAMGIARQMLDEILGRRFSDSGEIKALTGADSWKGSTSGRQLYSEIGDYYELTLRPPTDPGGEILGEDNGDGKRHPRFVLPRSARFEDWSVATDIYYVDESDLTKRLSGGATSGALAVEVSVHAPDGEGGRKELASVRRIVFHVPPMS